MLSGIKIFTTDPIWRQIVTELNGAVVDDVIMADVDLDALVLLSPLTPMQFKSAIISACDDTRILNDVFGRRVHLSNLYTQIIVRLYKHGAMNILQLRRALGYAPDAKTHAVETAIYGLRKRFGHDFIKNDGGLFHLGRI